MDLNQKYADFQKAIMSAKVASNPMRRDAHAEKAEGIAAQIEAYQEKLGAAAACAWSATMRAAL